MIANKTTKKWEIFPGRNKFYCDGRFMTAPHSGIFYLTVFLITFTCMLSFVFDLPYLTSHITNALPAVAGVLFLFTLGSLLKTSYSDPGIIPRATQDEANYIERQIEVPNSYNSPTLRPPPRTKEVIVRGHQIKLKYCYTCKIIRPPRASHCSVCDNCVDKFDHHCPWVGNCVGKRNYRYFYMFVTSLAFLTVFIFSCAITHIVLLVRDPPGSTILEAVKTSPASIIVAVICFFSIWSILGMAGFHTYLISTNQTTNEDIKGSFSAKRGQTNRNPYSRGSVCDNCWDVLCSPYAPSMIDRRGALTNENKLELEIVAIQKQNMPTMATYTQDLKLFVTENGKAHVNTDEDVYSIHLDDEITGKCSMPQSGSYSNLYRMDDSESKGVDSMMENVTLENASQMHSPIRKLESSDSHLYSNVANSNYMGHNLDLDPVVMIENTSKYTNYYDINDANEANKEADKLKNIVVMIENTSKYNNYYDTNKANKESDNLKNIEASIPNVVIDGVEKDRHLYSNVNHLNYMDHNLDLDPVILTNSNENLMSNDQSNQKQIVMVHEVPAVQFSNMQKCSFTNVSYKQDEDTVAMCDELNHNTIMALPMINTSDLNMNPTEQTWADKLPQNENSNMEIRDGEHNNFSLGATMIDTALDLDSLDGSTVSLWLTV